MSDKITPKTNKFDASQQESTSKTKRTAATSEGRVARAKLLVHSLTKGGDLGLDVGCQHNSAASRAVGRQ
jgi:hypothetical protein